MTALNYYKKLWLLSIVIFMALTLFMPAIAGAQGRESRQQRGTRPPEVEARISERREKGQEIVEEMRQSAGTAQSQEARQAACERRNEALTNAMAKISIRANTLLGVMDSFYLRVQKFYETGQLTVANYAELSDRVEKAQAEAKVEIAALGALNAVDCDSPDVAEAIAAFKDSSKAARDSLQEYRQSLVALISSMKAAASQVESVENTDDTQDNEE